MKYLGIVSLLLLLAFSSCRKDIEDIKIIKDTPDPTVIEGYVPNVQTINGSLIGFVVDENQEPVTDAAVKMGNLTTTTDAFGHFFFNEVDMNALGTFVQIEKVGYFEGSRRFFPAAAVKNRVKIELLEKNFNLSFNTESGGLVSLPEGGSIKFSPNSIKNEDGTLYNGVVSVAAKWMDPTNLRTFDQMPGNGQGVGFNTENEEKVLASYGIMTVELKGIAGEKLNIADGFTATLAMPIPNELEASAPNEISLWYFNEEYGIWHEQFKATLQNGTYVGDVSHFSSWYCGNVYDFIQLIVNLLDENGKGVSNMKVVVSIPGIGFAAGYTNDEGSVTLEVPANEELFIAVYDIVCLNQVIATSVGVFTGGGAETFISSIPMVNNTVVSGKLVCNGEPIEEGLIRLGFDGVYQYHYLDNTNFTILTNACLSTTEIEVVGINLADLEQSEVVLITPNVVNDIGIVDICQEDIDQYITITVDGVTELYNIEPSIWINTIDGFSSISADNGIGSHLSLVFPGAHVGVFSDIAVISSLFYPTNNWSFNSGSTFTTFTVTEFGAVGEPVIGTFEGILTNHGVNPTEDVLVTGSFRIIRTE